MLDDVDLRDWTLIVESYPNAVHNSPRLTGPPRPPRTGPRIVTTTLQYLRAARGRLIVRDFGSSWGMDAPNLELEMTKGTEYRGTMRFAGGTLLIQQYEPMWANFTSAFAVRDGKVVMERMALDADGAQVRGTGIIDAARWPESTFQITSRHQLPRTRAIFYARDTFALHGEGDFTGTAHKYNGGYEVKGEFVSPEVGYDDYRFQDFRASVVWVPERFDVLAADAGFYGGRAAFTYQLAPLGVPGRRADAVWDVTYTDVDLTTFTDFLETRGLRLAGRASGRTKLALDARPPRGGGRRRLADGHHARRRRAGGARSASRGGRRRSPPRRGPRAVQPAQRAGPAAHRRPGRLRVRRRRDPLRAQHVRHRRDLRRLRGPHRLGPGLAPAVPRVEHQLAGEPPLPDRHHDHGGVADARRCRSTASAPSTASCSARWPVRASRARSAAGRCGPGTSPGATSRARR